MIGGVSRSSAVVPPPRDVHPDPTSAASKPRPEIQASARALTAPEQKQLEELKARDREVRAHEQAHVARAGPYANGVSYSYTTGPDGRRYATSGSASIDASPVTGDPGATLRKARVVQAAALAPGEPSAQDRAIAAQAAQMAADARRQMGGERGNLPQSSPAGAVLDRTA